MRWNRKEDTVIKTLYNQGVKSSRIAEIMVHLDTPRTASAIRGRLSRLNNQKIKKGE